jgi:hypothetical protein
LGACHAVSVRVSRVCARGCRTPCGPWGRRPNVTGPTG